MKFIEVPPPERRFNFHDQDVNNLFNDLPESQRYSLVERLGLRETLDHNDGLQLQHISLANGRSEVIMRKGTDYIGAFTIEKHHDGTISYDQYRVRANDVSKEGFKWESKTLDMNGGGIAEGTGKPTNWLDRIKSIFSPGESDSQLETEKKKFQLDQGIDVKYAAGIEAKQMHVDQTWGKIETSGEGIGLGTETNVFSEKFSGGAGGSFGLDHKGNVEKFLGIGAEGKLGGPDASVKATYFRPVDEEDGKLTQSWVRAELGAASGLQGEIKYGLINDELTAKVKGVVGVGGSIGVSGKYSGDIDTSALHDSAPETAPHGQPQAPVIDRLKPIPDAGDTIHQTDEAKPDGGSIDSAHDRPASEHGGPRNPPDDITGPDFDELSKRDQHALNRIADEKFYAEHPELQGKPLSPDAPADLKEEWLKQREDALHRSWENTAVDQAYRDYYAEKGITPPDKIDPNNPDDAEFLKTWNKLKGEVTGAGDVLQGQLDSLIADTQQQLAHLGDSASAKLAEVHRQAEDAVAAADSSEKAATRAQDGLTATDGHLQTLASMETAAEAHQNAATDAATQAKAHVDAVTQADGQAKQAADHAETAENSAREHAQHAGDQETLAAGHAEKAAAQADAAQVHAEHSAASAEAAQTHAAAAAQAETDAQRHAESADASEAAATSHAAKAESFEAAAQAHAEQAAAAENSAQTHAAAARDQAGKAHDFATQAGTADEAAAASEQSAVRDAGLSTEHEHESASAATDAGRAVDQAHTESDAASAHAEGAATAEHDAGEHATQAGTHDTAAHAHATTAGEQENLAQQHAEAAGTAEGEARTHAEHADTQLRSAQTHDQGAADQATAAGQHAAHAADHAKTAADHAGQATHSLEVVTGLVQSADDAAGGAQTHAESAGTADQQAEQSAAQALAFVDQIHDANAHAAESQQAAAQSAESAAEQVGEAAGHAEKAEEWIATAHQAIEATAGHATRAATQLEKAAEAEHQAGQHFQKTQENHTAAEASARAATEHATHAGQQEEAAQVSATATETNLTNAAQARQHAADDHDLAEQHARESASLADKAGGHASTAEQMHAQAQSQLQQLSQLMDQGHAMIDLIQSAQREAFDAVDIARVRRQMRAIQQSISSLDS